MSTVGQIERKTQERVVALFRDALGYEYLGNWIDRVGNANVEHTLLHGWLKKRGVDDASIGSTATTRNTATSSTTRTSSSRSKAPCRITHRRPSTGTTRRTSQGCWRIDLQRLASDWRRRGRR
jgi:hypothetical protein